MKKLILTLLSFLILIAGNTQATLGPVNGSLIIMGGAMGRDTIAIKKFIELAGGKDASFVYIPTAGDDQSVKRSLKSFKQRWLANHGITNILALHTRDPKVANSDEFVKALKEADGVWIPGGRQWRLADSYLNTKVHEELHNVLKRGGVIAGSSAGATIQGSYLIRGDTKKNTIIMGDHEEGLSFITNVAIDQHLFARNRQFDMFELLPHRPELLGIGLDEGAAILVQANVLEVITDRYVAIYDGTRVSAERDTTYQLPPESKAFYVLKKGEFYNLKYRTIVDGRKKD